MESTENKKNKSATAETVSDCGNLIAKS